MDRADNIRRLKMQAELPKPKKQYIIPSLSKKKQQQMQEEKKDRIEGETELQRWFKARQKEMTGVCAECGSKTETQFYRFAILSLCHILAKRPTVCPSVAYHPVNCIELCPDHHAKFDSSTWDEKEKWGCWPIVLERLVAIEPYVAREERKHLPKQLLDYLERTP